jgi:uncharacterized protein (TIGR03086 family)
VHANELHAQTQQVFAGVLGQVADDDLALPTPCEGWTVADLVQHLLDGHARVVAAAGAAMPELPGGRLEAFATAAAAAQAVFDAPDGLTRPFELPFGSVPGAVFALIRAGDAYAHAWDLATAIGADADLDPEVGEAVLAATAPILPPTLRGTGKPFGVEQPCDPGRPVADRYAAFVGRCVS